MDPPHIYPPCEWGCITRGLLTYSASVPRKRKWKTEKLDEKVWGRGGGWCLHWKTYFKEQLISVKCKSFTNGCSYPWATAGFGIFSQKYHYPVCHNLPCFRAATTKRSTFQVLSVHWNHIISQNSSPFSFMLPRTPSATFTLVHGFVETFDCLKSHLGSARRPLQ